MKAVLISVLCLCIVGCSPRTAKIIEDVIEGEAQVIEKVVDDTAQANK